MWIPTEMNGFCSTGHSEREDDDEGGVSGFLPTLPRAGSSVLLGLKAARGDWLRCRFFKQVEPDLLTTDVVAGPTVDLVLDAQEMALDGNSVGAFYGVNCFHHFNRPRSFLSELVRTVVPGGWLHSDRAVLWAGILALLHRNLPRL